MYLTKNCFFASRHSFRRICPWRKLSTIFCSAFITLIENGNEYQWQAYLLAVLLFLSGGVFGVTIHYSIMARDRAGIHVRTALTAAIYRKVQ